MSNPRDEKGFENGGDAKETQRDPREYQHREKYWSELTPDQRIERMRNIVKGYASEIRMLRREVHALSQHQHGQDGKVVIGLHTLEIGMMGEPSYPRTEAEEYF